MDAASLKREKERKKCTVPLDDKRQVSRLLCVDREATFKSFFHDVLCPTLEPHAEHQFRSMWQARQFSKNVDNVNDGELVIAMDFSENYTCRYGREIQSYHWNQKQVTLHPMMLYYKEGQEVQKEGFVCITDDLKHDTHAVSRFESEAIEHVRNKGVNINCVHEWTDGCASQYKGRHSFAAISLGEELHNANITRNYFETSHGKGPCDGLGGIVKHKVSHAIIQNPSLSITNAKELHQFSEENLSKVGQSTFKSRTTQYSSNKRTFKYIEKIDRSSATTAKTLKGSCKLHSVAGTGVGYQLRIRDLSCYCTGCRGDSKCVNNEHVGQWAVQALKTDDGDKTVSANDRNTEDNGDNEYSTEPVERTTDNHEVHVATNRTEHQPNEFVAVKFQIKKSKLSFFAKILEIEKDEVRVEYLEKNGKYYQYRSVPDVSWQHKNDIVCKLAAPDNIVTGSRVKCLFKLTDEQRESLNGFQLK